MNRVRAAREAEQASALADAQRQADEKAAAARSLTYLGLEALEALTKAGVPPQRPHKFKETKSVVWAAGRATTSRRTEVIQFRIPQPTWQVWGAWTSTVWLTEIGDLYGVWRAGLRSRYMPLALSDSSVSPRDGEYHQVLDLRRGLYIPQLYDEPDINFRRGIAAGVLALIEAHGRR